jgi:hypothetical protein
MILKVYIIAAAAALGNSGCLANIACHIAVAALTTFLGPAKYMIIVACCNTAAMPNVNITLQFVPLVIV